MTLNLGTLQTEIRSWLTDKKKLVIDKWDFDSPDTLAKRRIDGLVYPSNTAIMGLPNNVSYENTYGGIECTCKINLQICYRFLLTLYKTKAAIPIEHSINLYSYICTQLIRDFRSIHDDIIDIKIENQIEPITIKQDEKGSNTKDWLLFINFTLNVKFNSNFTGYAYQDIGLIEFPGVSPLLADQVALPDSNGNLPGPEGYIQKPWNAEQVAVKIETIKDPGYPKPGNGSSTEIIINQ